MSSDLEQQVESLRGMSRQQVQDRWRDFFRAAPPAAFTPELLARGIAWRMQEKSLGGLSAEARRLIGAGRPGRVARSNGGPVLVRLSGPGNRLVRRWRGRTYVVEVVDNGLVYQGERFASLSVIAGKITGTRWSGTKFFGLVA